ncbi:MAG: hypothetical protein AB7G75_05915 [Candidatus Binatia bacterium]
MTGPRQMGKTTVLQQLCEAERRYVTLDNLAVRTLARQDPELKTLLYRLACCKAGRKNSRLSAPLAARRRFRVINTHEDCSWSLMKFWRR